MSYLRLVCQVPEVYEHDGDDHDGTQSSPRCMAVAPCDAAIMVSVTTGGEAGDRLESLELVTSWEVGCLNGHVLATGNSEDGPIKSYDDIREDLLAALVNVGLIVLREVD